MLLCLYALDIAVATMEKRGYYPIAEIKNSNKFSCFPWYFYPKFLRFSNVPHMVKRKGFRVYLLTLTLMTTFNTHCRSIVTTINSPYTKVQFSNTSLESKDLTFTLNN